MASNKKTLDTELDLVAFISLLSVLICALLLTAVWIQISSMNVKQSIGGSGAKSVADKTPVLLVNFRSGGVVTFRVQHSKMPKKLRTFRVRSIKKEAQQKFLQNYLKNILKADSNLDMAFINPRPGTVYEEMVVVMDNLKQAGMKNLGISPF